MKLRWFHLKNTLLTLLMLLLVILAIAGTNLSLQLARLLLPQFVSGLHFTAVSGDLWRGAVFEQLVYQDAQAKISINRLETRLNWRCFSRRMLCLDYLTVTGTAVEVLAVSKDAALNPAESNLPQTAGATSASAWAVQLDALTVKDFSFSTAELQGSVTSLQSAGRFEDQQLTLAPTKVQGVQLVSFAAAVSNAEAFRMPDLTAFSLPLAIDISALEVIDATLQQPGQQQLQLSALQLSASLQPQRWQLTLNEFSATSPSLQAEAKLNWQRDTLDTAGTAEGTFAASMPELVPNQRLHGTLMGSLAKLQLQLQLSGAQQASADATLDLTKPQLPFSLKLTAENLYWPLTDAASAIYQASSVRLDVEGSLDQQQFSGELKATVPDLPNSALRWRGIYQHASRQLLLDELQINTLNGSMNIKGLYDLQQQQLTSQWDLKNIQPGLYWTDYAGEFSGSFYLAAGLQPQLELAVEGLNIHGNLRELPLNLTGALKASLQPTQQPDQQADHWQLNTEQLVLSHGPNQIRASGGLDQEWQLAVTVNIADLAASLSQSEGQLVGDIKVSGPATAPDLALLLTGSNLNYQDDYVLGQIELKAKIADWGKKASSMSLIAKQGQAPGLQLQQLDWQLSGTRLQHDSHLLINSHQLQATMAMQGQLQADNWQAQWLELHLKSDVGDWQLNQPTQSNWSLAKQHLSLDAFCLQDNNASLCIQALKQASLKKGELQLDLTTFELAALSPLLPDEQSISGQIDGQIKLGWQQGQLPTALVKLTGGAGKLEYQSTSLLEMPWQQLAIDASLNPQQLSGNLQMQLASRQQTAGKSITQAVEPAAQKVQLQLGITALDTPDKQVDARLQLQQFDLAFLQPVFSEFSQFGAMLNGDLRATGALNNPLLQGQLKLENLQLNGRQAPMEIADSTVTLTFADRKALLSGALRTPEGPLNISGDANWQVANGWYGSVQLSGEKLKLLLPNASFSFSPDLIFSAEPEGGLLSGEVLLENGKMEVDALPENAIRVSDDEVVRSAAVVDSSGLPPWKLSSDIRLTLGENVRLAAFGLDTKLQGVLRIRQQGLVPTIHGQVTLRDGTFRAYGQDLELRKGKLTFNGPADQPLMAIEAIRNPEKTEDNVIAGIQVDGLTDNPVIKVFSTPAKPQANALAYLLLGRDLTSSSSDKSVTTSLIGIGIASSGKLVGQLGEVFGLRELSLDTAGSGDASKVMVSGYLSPKLQLKYGMGIFNQVGEFTLRYRLARKLFLEAVSGFTDSVDLLYQVEFD